MIRQEWLMVGLKLLGVYFVVSGLASLWQTLLILIVAGQHGGKVGEIGAIGILQPAVYLVAGFFLMKSTRSCLGWCGESPPDTFSSSGTAPPIGPH